MNMLYSFFEIAAFLCLVSFSSRDAERESDRMFVTDCSASNESIENRGFRCSARRRAIVDAGANRRCLDRCVNLRVGDRHVRELARSQTHRGVPAAVGGVNADSDKKAVHVLWGDAPTRDGAGDVGKSCVAR